MKKLKKLTLVEGTRVLSNPEMKHLQGGDIHYVYCHCKGNTGEGVSANSCGSFLKLFLNKNIAYILLSCLFFK